MQNGSYQFENSKLKDAHSYCRNKAQDAVKSKISKIVIDNTNVMKWEMGPYNKMGRSEGYIVLLVEPKTPWRLDVDILTEKNSHGVSKDILNKKIKMYMPIIPAYFGWFLCSNDSKKLLSGSKKLLQSCLNGCDMFRSEFGDLLLPLNTTNYFNHPNAKNSNKHRSLHCTSKYCGRPKNGQYSQNILTYASDPKVIESVGMLSKLTIIGFVITKKNFRGKGTTFKFSDGVIWSNRR